MPGVISQGPKRGGGGGGSVEPLPVPGHYAQMKLLLSMSRKQKHLLRSKVETRSGQSFPGVQVKY